jgi:hypothetical protein
VLRTALEKGTSGTVYADLNSAIADVMPEVQAAIRRVAEWFVPAKRREQFAARTMEEIVDIGIEATRLAHQGFTPDIERDIDEIVIYAAISLSEFTDILFTLLDNVYCHSGNTQSPWVRLRISAVDVNSTETTVIIRMESQVAIGAYGHREADKLARIRQQMDSGEYRSHVNLEGVTQNPKSMPGIS